MVVVVIVSYIVGIWCFPELCGSYNLGNNIYMLDWDGNTRIIVFCSSKEGNVCKSGVRLIPKDLNYDITVENVNFNDRWIIAKTSNKKTIDIKYYLIDKSFSIDDDYSGIVNLERYIYSESDSINFWGILNENDVDLRFCE